MKLKKLMFLSLGLALGVSLASCGDDVKPTDPTPETVDPTPTPTPGGNEEAKVNLNKTYVLEENNSFFGALNVTVKDDVLEAISLMMHGMPTVLKPVYENGTIKSITMISLESDVFYNFTLTDSLTISGIKITKTTNGIKISNKAGTIWAEVGKDFSITTSSTVAEKASATYDDGSTVTIVNNKFTYQNDDDKIEVTLNGMNLDYAYYNDGKVSMNYKAIQDANNPLKYQFVQKYDSGDDNGFIVRAKMDFELNADYTVKNSLRSSYDDEVFGVKQQAYVEYVKTDAGYNMTQYNMYSGKKSEYMKYTCECLEGTNLPIKMTIMMGTTNVGEQTTTYDSNLNVLTTYSELPYGSNSTTYTYDDTGNKATQTRISFNYSYDPNTNTKVVAGGTKNEITYDSFGNEVKSITSSYNKTTEGFDKLAEKTATYDLTGDYLLSLETVELKIDGSKDTGSKTEYTYDENHNLTSEVNSYYNSTDDRYYKTSETNYTYEENKVTTEQIYYDDKETNPNKSKSEETTTETGSITIDYGYNSTDGYYISGKTVVIIGTNGLDETTEHYNYVTDYVLVQKEVTTYGQNGLDFVTTGYDVNGATETVTSTNEKRYDVNGNLTYHERKALYDDGDPATQDELTRREYEEYAYNSNGDYTTYIDAKFYDDGGEMSISKRIYEYDEQFRITKETQYGSLATDAEPNYIVIWTYSKDGDNDKIVETCEYPESGNKDVHTYIKNANGLVSKKNDNYEKDGGTEYKLTYSNMDVYNEYLELAHEEATQLSNGTKSYYETTDYEYNDNSKIETTLKYYYASDGTIKSAEKEVEEIAYLYSMMLSYKEYDYNKTTEKFDLITEESTYVYGENHSYTSDTTMIRYSYNSSNVLIGKTTNKYINGIYEKEIEETYVYDSDNKLTAESRRIRYDFADEDHYYESNWNPTTEAWGEETQKTSL